MADPLTKGQVPVTLDGTDYTLTPNLTAFSQLASKGASYTTVIQAIVNNDVGEMIRVLRLGLQWGDADAKRLPELVMRTGLGALYNPLTDYVFRLFNGGKSAEEITAEAKARAAAADEAADAPLAGAPAAL